MRRLLALLVTISLITVFAGCEKKPKYELEEVTDNGDGTYTCSFDGIEHDYIVCLPDEYEGAPLIVMLHGAGGSATLFMNDIHMEEQANPMGYAVVYVSGAIDTEAGSTERGWNSGMGNGTNRDVEFLTALVDHLTEEFSLDKDHVYAAGFSNGAFMTFRLAMEAGDTFRACVSVAGRMTSYVWEHRNENNNTGFFQLTGMADEVIPMNYNGSAKYSRDPAIEDVIDFMAESNGLELYETSESGPCHMFKYGGGTREVWHLAVAGLHHGWPTPERNGIDTNGLIMEFFEANK